MIDLYHFYLQNSERLFGQLAEHLGLVVISVLLACIISIPLGIYIAHKSKISSVVLNTTGILQTIPSIALLGFLIPVLGIGWAPAIFALFLYSLLPILRNVYTGITEIDKAIIDSAIGLGMAPGQILWRITLPLALPTIFAGVRTATVINVGVATLAAYIGAGGLGEFIFGGIALNNSTMILAGALPSALLAILLDAFLSLLQKGVQPKKSLISALVFIFLTLGLFAFQQKSESSLQAAMEPEFIGRSDGLPALQNSYKFNLSYSIMGQSLMYEALKNNYVDVIVGYSTDARIKSYHLQVLEDDKQVFPPYQAALLINKETIKNHPKLQAICEQLSGKINDSIMTDLNYQVDELNRSVAEVAHEFLISKKLYHKPQKANAELIIGSKIFTEQYILAELYKQLIEGHLPLSVETKKGLGGTKICFEALLNNNIQMYPEYTGTALQVMINDSTFKAHNPKEVYTFVDDKLFELYKITQLPPIGFNNTYALLMNHQQAEKENIKNISDLLKQSD